MKSKRLIREKPCESVSLGQTEWFLFHRFISPQLVCVMQLWVVSQPENQQPRGHLLFDPFHSEVSEWSSIDF